MHRVLSVFIIGMAPDYAGLDFLCLFPFWHLAPNLHCGKDGFSPSKECLAMGHCLSQAVYTRTHLIVLGKVFGQLRDWLHKA